MHKIFAKQMTKEEIAKQIKEMGAFYNETKRQDIAELLSQLRAALAIKEVTNWKNEAVATDKEKAYAQETERMMHDAGYDGTYAGGSRSKGNGFWLTKNGKSLGYKNCRSIRGIVNS